MATVEQVQRGIASFIDTEFAPQLDDAKQRLLVGGLGGLFAANAGRVLAANKDKAGLALLGVMKEDGTVDVDAVYQAFAPRMEEPVKFDIPFVGRISFRRDDLDRLVQYIREA